MNWTIWLICSIIGLLWVGHFVYCSRFNKHVVIFYWTNHILSDKLRFKAMQKFYNLSIQFNNFSNSSCELAILFMASGSVNMLSYFMRQIIFFLTNWYSRPRKFYTLSNLSNVFYGLAILSFVLGSVNMLSLRAFWNIINEVLPKIKFTHINWLIQHW